MKYQETPPIESPIPADRQGAKRHYGVHPYFTRRPYNVVRSYILHYSAEGDRVLDPFGGSGVTAIEAFLENRIGIQNDINPLANFIAQGTADLTKGDISELREALHYIESRCKRTLDEIYNSTDGRVEEIQKSISLPKNITLPKTSDVESYYELFSPKQLLSLAVLKAAVESIEDATARRAMRLAWSATLAKLNKTFLSAEGRAESRGGSSIFSIYRYKVAKEPVELPAWETFHERAVNIIKANSEVIKVIKAKEQIGGWRGRFEMYCEDIETLSHKLRNSIDYIFADPPYGGHISYLDLSTLWNAWLDLLPDIKTRENEMIVGGELSLTEDHYTEKLSKSIEACVKMLKRGRWLSVVFQHWKASYFETILSSAEESGAELKAAVSQVGDPIWSMHKKKNKDSVLAGELILTSCKTGQTKKTEKNGAFDVPATIENILARTESNRVYGELLFNKLIIEAWKASAVSSLNITKHDFTSILEQRGWHYDKTNHYWIKNSRERRTLFDFSDN